MLNHIYKRKNFAEEYSLEKRKEMVQHFLCNYPDRIPIIIEKNKTCTLSSELDKRKYLFPKNYTMDHVLYMIHRKLKINSDQNIYIYIGKLRPSSPVLIEEIYKHYADESGFLNLTYTNKRKIISKYYLTLSIFCGISLTIYTFYILYMIWNFYSI